MTLRAIIVATEQEARVLAAKVDIGHGYPRCDLLAGTLTLAGEQKLSCPCLEANVPDPACRFVTRTQVSPVKLANDTWAYPVDEDEKATMAVLSKDEQDRIVVLEASSFLVASVLSKP